MNQTENFNVTSLCADKILQNNVNSNYYARNNAYYANIMPALCLMLLPTYCVKNYVDIIDSSLIHASINYIAATCTIYGILDHSKSDRY